MAAGLAPAPAARTTSCGWWTSGPRPARLVEVPAGGRVTRLLDGRVTGSEQVAMTVERRGGASRPTSEPVVVVDLRADPGPAPPGVRRISCWVAGSGSGNWAASLTRKASTSAVA